MTMLSERNGETLDFPSVKSRLAEKNHIHQSRSRARILIHEHRADLHRLRFRDSISQERENQHDRLMSVATAHTPSTASILSIGGNERIAQDSPVSAIYIESLGVFLVKLQAIFL